MSSQRSDDGSVYICTASNRTRRPRAFGVGRAAAQLFRSRALIQRTFYSAGAGLSTCVASCNLLPLVSGRLSAAITSTPYAAPAKTPIARARPIRALRKPMERREDCADRPPEVVTEPLAGAADFAPLPALWKRVRWLPRSWRPWVLPPTAWMPFGRRARQCCRA